MEVVSPSPGTSIEQNLPFRTISLSVTIVCWRALWRMTLFSSFRNWWWWLRGRNINHFQLTFLNNMTRILIKHIYSNIRLARANNENCTLNEKLVFVVQIRRSLLLCSHGNYDITCRSRQDNSGIQMNMILLRIHCFHLENYMVLDLIW